MLISCVIWLYRLLMSYIQLEEYIVISDSLIKVSYESFRSLAPNGDFNNFRFYQYLFFFIFDPKKLSIIADTFASVAFGLEQDWPKFSFFAVPLIPSFLIEYVLFTIFPFLAMPFVDIKYYLRRYGGNLVAIIDNNEIDAANSANAATK